MDPNSGRVMSEANLEALREVDAREAAKFTDRIESLKQAIAIRNDAVEVEYTAQETSDLAGLRDLRKQHKPQLRSGDPSVVAEAQTYLNAVEIEVRKIHRAAEFRARLAAMGVGS